MTDERLKFTEDRPTCSRETDDSATAETYAEAVDTGMTCDRCGGPLLQDGSSSWVCHGYDECIRWLAMRDREAVRPLPDPCNCACHFTPQGRHDGKCCDQTGVQLGDIAHGRWSDDRAGATCACGLNIAPGLSLPYTAKDGSVHGLDACQDAPESSPGAFPEPPEGMTWAEVAEVQARANCPACAGLTEYHTHDSPSVDDKTADLGSDVARAYAKAMEPRCTMDTGAVNLFCLVHGKYHYESVPGSAPDAGTDWQTIAHALAMDLIETRRKLEKFDYNIAKNGHPRSPALEAYNDVVDRLADGEASDDGTSSGGETDG